MADFDLITLGRSGLDLYAEQVGVPFEETRSFAAYVGGTPANIAVGARRLGLRTLLSTAVSADPVGDFIVRFLQGEGIDTRYVHRKPGIHSGLVLLGILPPDCFPRVHYRDDCADHHLTPDDVAALPFDRSRVLVVVGTSLTHSPAREATLFAAAEARRVGVLVVLDLDYRDDLWPDLASYTAAVRDLVAGSDVVIGTEEEILAAVGNGERLGTDEPVSATIQPNGGTIEPDVPVRKAVHELFDVGPDVVVEKRGARGCRVHAGRDEVIDVPGFEVEVQNTLGAGDAFAAGLVYGRLNDWDWYRSARYANACGAIVVTRHACSASCPRHHEVTAFIDENGGFE